MEILHSEFGVERLAVTDGGHINGAFLAAELLDELSLLSLSLDPLRDCLSRAGFEETA